PLGSLAKPGDCYLYPHTRLDVSLKVHHPSYHSACRGLGRSLCNPSPGSCRLPYASSLRVRHPLRDNSANRYRKKEILNLYVWMNGQRRGLQRKAAMEVPSLILVRESLPPRHRNLVRKP